VLQWSQGSAKQDTSQPVRRYRHRTVAIFAIAHECELNSKRLIPDRTNLVNEIIVRPGILLVPEGVRVRSSHLNIMQLKFD